MASRDVLLPGTRELDRFLSVLPKNMQKGGYRAALTAAADPPLEEARMRAAGWSANVARALRKGSPRQNQDGSFSIRIYVDERRPDGFLGYFGEYGVKLHMIPKKGARIKLRIGDRVITGPISHPGHAAHPFLRPSLDNTTSEIVQAFAQRLAAYIEGKTGFDPTAGLDEAA